MYSGVAEQKKHKKHNISLFWAGMYTWTPMYLRTKLEKTMKVKRKDPRAIFIFLRRRIFINLI